MTSRLTLVVCCVRSLEILLMAMMSQGRDGDVHGLRAAAMLLTDDVTGS